MSVAKPIGESAEEAIIRNVNEHFTPERIRGLSTEIGEPVDKTAAAVQEAIRFLVERPAVSPNPVDSLMTKTGLSKQAAFGILSAVGPVVLSFSQPRPGTAPLRPQVAGVPEAVGEASHPNWLKPALIGAAILVVGLWIANWIGPRPNVPAELVLPPGPSMSADSMGPPEPPRVPMQASTVSSNDELAQFLLSGSVTELPKRILFEELNFVSGTTQLTPASLNSLNRLGELLNQHPTAKLRLEGHTDSSGDPALNQILSLRRAQAVKEQLVQRQIAPNRLETVGQGQLKPLQSNATPAGRLANRRIEIVVTDL